MILGEVISLLLVPFERRAVSAATAAAFYKTREWAQLRYAALIKHGRRCGGCGASAPNARLVVDHVKPLRTHWHLRLKLSNLQVLCNICNRGKGARRDDWRKPTNAP